MTGPDSGPATDSRGAAARPVVLYDGDCRFCVAQAARLARLAGRDLELVSFRATGVLQRFPQLTREACERALQVVWPDGRVATGAAAVAQLVALRRGLGWVAALQRLPGLRGASEAAYAAVAANRFRIAGRVGDGSPGAGAECAACAVHFPAATATTDPDRATGPLSAPRALVREVFLRGLGVVFLCAFVSLLAQVVPLFGARGLAPVGDWFERLALFAREGGLRTDLVPTVFAWGHSDVALLWSARAGVVLSGLLVLGVAPRLVLALLWLLYLSFVNVGQDFLSFQWDSLLLEMAFFGWLVAPWTWRLSRARDRPVHPALVLLMLWLLLRLNVESGIAKWFAGDQRWADGLALDTYFETAPLPTALAWWAHQLPHGVLRVLTAGTLVLETIVPWFAFGPRRLRLPAFLALLSMQVAIAATANYGFFNLASALLLVWLLDDRHLRRLARRPRPAHVHARSMSPASGAACWALALVLVPLSALPFLDWLPRTPAVRRAAESCAGLLDVLAPWHTLNGYALFVNMTTERREIEIEGSDDGSHWETYPFLYRPGDPLRAPGLVAPCQPRLDFQCWFLLLGGPPRADWFANLMTRLGHDPQAVAPLLGPLPFDGRPPHWLRFGIWRYTFASPEERQATGAFWHRELERHSSAWATDELPR